MVDAASCQESAGEEEELVAVRRPSLPNEGLAAQARWPDEEWQAWRRWPIIRGARRLDAAPSAPPANQRRCRIDAARLAVATPVGPLVPAFSALGRSRALPTASYTSVSRPNTVTAPTHKIAGSRLAMHV
jgi:hypothetical protein